MHPCYFVCMTSVCLGSLGSTYLNRVGSGARDTRKMKRNIVQVGIIPHAMRQAYTFMKGKEKGVGIGTVQALSLGNGVTHTGQVFLQLI